MARVLLGHDKGKEVKIIQWCNDWASCSDGKTRKITNFTFTKSEIDMILAHDNNGTLLNEFTLLPNRRFVRNTEKEGLL